MRGGIFSGPDAALDAEEQLRIVTAAPEMAGQNLSAAVSVESVQITPATAERIGNLAVLDLGVKQSTLDNLAARGFDVHVLPQASTFADITAIDPVAVFYSNGPGDPVRIRRTGRRAPRGARRRPALLRHLLRQPAVRPRARPRHLQAHVRAPRHQPAGARQGHGPGRDHRAQPRLRGRGADRGVVRQPERLRQGRGQPRRPQRPGGRGPAARSTSRRSRCSTTRRRPPARTTPTTSSTASATSSSPTSHTFRLAPLAQRPRTPMPKRPDIHSVLVIGSGPIVIGQACEFDYSGTQACRVLREEGVRVILVNSNPATIMTDPDFADATYIEPITPEVIETIIAKEKPDAILPTLGGQTALNAAMALHERGILDKYGVELIGAKVEAIQKGEDRQIFKQLVIDAGADVARVRIAHTDGGGARGSRGARLPAGRAPVVHDGRTRIRLRLRRGRPSPHRRRGPARLARRPRCSWRSRSSAGRSTSSSSCATPPTTRWWSARSRTSTRSACTPATRSRSLRRSRSPTASTRTCATSASTSSAPSASTPAAATSSSR